MSEKLCHRPGAKVSKIKCRQNKKKQRLLKKKQLGLRFHERFFLTDKKLKSENVNFFGSCYLGKLCKDKKCILIELNSVICKKCSMPIHKKCSILLNFVIKDNYYCCHDCYIDAKMTGDGFTYKFVSRHEDE